MSHTNTLPEPPVSVAQVKVTRQGKTRTVVLREVKTWTHHLLDGTVDAHRVQPSTMLAPAVHPGEGTVVWLMGYDLDSHDEIGDTLFTSALLLELSPRSSGNLRALWYEDHQEVPHTFAMGAGPARPGKRDGLVHFTLSLTDADYGDEIKLEGSLRRLR